MKPTKDRTTIPATANAPLELLSAIPDTAPIKEIIPSALNTVITIKATKMIIANTRKIVNPVVANVLPFSFLDSLKISHNATAVRIAGILPIKVPAKPTAPILELYICMYLWISSAPAPPGAIFINCPKELVMDEDAIPVAIKLKIIATV